MSNSSEKFEGNEADILGFDDLEELRDALEAVEATPAETEYMKKFGNYPATPRLTMGATI